MRRITCASAQSDQRPSYSPSGKYGVLLRGIGRLGWRRCVDVFSNVGTIPVFLGQPHDNNNTVKIKRHLSLPQQYDSISRKDTSQKVILLPSADLRRVVAIYKRQHEQEVLDNCLVRLTQEESVVR